MESARRRLPRLAEVPFESERRLMATFHAEGERFQVFVKGAPDAVLARCETLLGPRGAAALAGAARAEVLQVGGMLAARGLRVLAVASGTLPRTGFEPGTDLFPRVGQLTFLGLVGLTDPPRPEAKEALAQCREAGIEVRMMTGDHRGTASAIAGELGIRGDVVDGADLDRMSDAQLAARVEDIGVFARVSPEHKLRIVRALRARGHVVAMTGDGVNDAPALKSADIGVAMGSGTEVAKEAATMVLTDDNFASIVRVVREGRTIYDNIVKFVRYQLSTNVGALLTVFLAPLVGLGTPLKPIHILFVAMFADGPPALALGLDPPGPGIMRQPPRDPDLHILTGRRLGVLLFYGAIMAGGTLGLLSAGNFGAERGTTVAFTTFVLFQLFNLLNARSEGGSAFTRQLFTNFRLWVAVAVVASLQVAVVQWGPLRRLFGTVPLSLAEGGAALGVASTLVVFDELRKGAAHLRPWRGARARWRHGHAHA